MVREDVGKSAWPGPLDQESPGGAFRRRTGPEAEPSQPFPSDRPGMPVGWGRLDSSSRGPPTQAEAPTPAGEGPS